MRRSIVIVFCLALLFLPTAGNPATAGPDLRFDENVWDFGTIEELDGKVSHTFSFTNVSDRPLVLEAVAVTCGCTQPEYSKAPIRPGEKRTITITYDPTDRPGPFNKTITVISGGGRNRNVLRIKGEVTGRPRTVEERYPFVVAGGVRLNTLHAPFRYIPQHGRRSMVIDWINPTDRELRLDTLRRVTSGVLHAVLPQTLAPGAEGSFTLTYDLTDVEAYGMLSDQFYLVIDGQRSAQPLSATAIGIDDFSRIDPGRAATMKLSTQFHDFGDVRRGERPTFLLTVENTGHSMLIIRKLACSEGLSVPVFDEMIAPGGKLALRFEFDPDSQEFGTYYGSATLTVNDPEAPLREIRFVARIVD